MPVQTSKERKRTIQQTIDLLEELGGHKREEQKAFTFQGERLIIPEKWGWKDVRVIATREEAAEQEEGSWEKTFDYRPWDGAWCLQNVLSKLYGTFSLSGRMGWFGPEPPRMIAVNSGVDEQVQVPWGVFALPETIPGVTFTCGGMGHPEKGVLFQLTAEGPKKMLDRINGVFNAVEQELKTNSLYRGKAFTAEEMPEFVDLYAVDRNKVVYSTEVERMLSTHILSRLRNAAIHGRAGQTFKRAVLLHGPFGTGKTLGCMVTGQVAVESGCTFIVARPGRDNISIALQTARLYAGDQGAVVFYEDADGAVDDHYDRDAISRLLDDFDGIKAKGAKVMVVMTTNYPDKIPAGMLRPGRIDRTIEIDDLDAQGIARLVATVLPPERLDPEVDWDVVYADAQGYKPAFVIEFAGEVLANLIDTYGEDYDQHLIGTEELAAAARDLRAQYNMMLGAKGMPQTDTLAQAVERVVTNAVRENIDEDYLVYNGDH